MRAIEITSSARRKCCASLNVPRGGRGGRGAGPRRGVGRGEPARRAAEEGPVPVPRARPTCRGWRSPGTVVDGDAAAMAEAGLKRGDASARWWRAAAMPTVASRRWAVLPSPAALTDVEGPACRKRSSPSGPTCSTAPPEWRRKRCWCRAEQRHRRHRDPAGEGGRREVIVTSLRRQAAACIALGADHAINYKSHDFVAEVKRITDGRAGATSCSTWWPATTWRASSQPADDGRLVIIAVQGGVKSQIDAGAVLRRRLTITGSTLRPRSVQSIGDREGAAHDGVALAGVGQGQAVIHQVFPAERAAEAHARWNRTSTSASWYCSGDEGELTTCVANWWSATGR